MKKVYQKDNEVLTIEQVEYAPNPRTEQDNLGTIICQSSYVAGDKHNYRNMYDFLCSIASQSETVLDALGKDPEDASIEELLEAVKEDVVILPIYAYIHGGVTIKTTPFSDPWDSGQIGFIYATKDRFRKETAYSESELFSTDTRRVPAVGEHVKVRGHESLPWYGRVRSMADDGMVTVDLDGNNNPDRMVTVPISDIVEVLSNRAVAMLEGEVREYDQYLRGDVWEYRLEEVTKCGCCDAEKRNLIDSQRYFYGSDIRTNGMLDELSQEWADFLVEVGV